MDSETDVMMKWILEEERLLEELDRIWKKQCQALDQHKRQIEALVQQREELARTAERAKRGSTASNASVDSAKSRDSQTRVRFSQTQDLSWGAGSVEWHADSADDIPSEVERPSTFVRARRTHTSDRHSGPLDFARPLVDRGHTLASTVSGNFAHLTRGGHVERHSLEDRAKRIHMAYASAAQKVQEKKNPLSVFGKFQEEGGQKPMSKWDGARYWVRVRMETTAFKTAVAVLILLNAAFIGVTADYSMRSSIETFNQHSTGDYVDVPRPEWADLFDVVFNLLFTCELSLRVYAQRCRFFTGSDRAWNVFEAVLVVLSLVEMILARAGFNPSLIRILRVVRVVRSVRTLRIMRFSGLSRKLRVMTLAIMNCSIMLCWAITILMLVTFLFAVVFLSFASQYVFDAGPDDPHVDDLRRYFGSLFLTMVTLFMTVTGGIDWGVVLEMFIDISLLYALVFMGFVMVTALAVLNVINAICVTDAMESTRTDPDLRMQGELEETRFMVERLSRMFSQMESEYGTGFIVDTDFVEQVERDDVKMQLALLGVYFSDGQSFFKLLDVEGNRSVSIDQFVMGCLCLKGGALLIDSNVMIKETKMLLNKTSREHRKAIESLSNNIKRVSEKVLDEEP